MVASVEPLWADDPRQVGGFRLQARLGAGGMGRVYLGYSPGGRPVAVKVVHSDLARDPEFMQRFRREVAAAQAVGGAYTAPVVGAGPDDSPPWLATTFVPGPPLADLVGQTGPLPEEAVWRLAGGLAEALVAIHAAGLVHRDLKPGNILIAPDGPKVIDFGISRTTSGTVVTATSMTIGTPAYMSPEQAQGLTVTPSSDIFSLGSVLAFAASGVSPFGGGEVFAIGMRVVHGQPDLTRVPESLRSAIDACLTKDPAERPSLGDLLRTVADNSALYPGVAPGKFWPDQVAVLLDSPTFAPALPSPPTPSAARPPTPTSEAPAAAPAATPPGTAPAAPVAPAGATHPTPSPVQPLTMTSAVPARPLAQVSGPDASARPAEAPARPAGPADAPAAPVAQRRRGPRWLVPVVLAVAVAIGAAIAIVLALSPAPKPPSFLPGGTGSATATATATGAG